MKHLIALLIALAAGPSFAAQTYKWVDENGRVVYGEKPPPGRAATPVDTTPSGSIERATPSPRPEAERRKPDEQRAQPAPVPAPARTDVPVRGMDFQTFARLQPGMTEGEVLVRAGQPDHESVENFRHDIVKTWYYFPTVANPFTTVVTMRAGRISNLDRVKKF
jgi:hypothetical protein